MKQCPRCSRTYEDAVVFCLRDGKPLVAMDAGSTEASGSPTESRPLPDPDVAPAPPRPIRTPLPGSSIGDSGASRSRTRFQTGIIQVMPPGSLLSGADGVGSSSPAQRKIVPWIPGMEPLPAAPAAPGASPFDAQLPPWEQAARSPVLHERSILPSPLQSPAAEPEELSAEDLVITPDIPEPPTERPAAAPVGDETVIVPVDASREEDLDLDLEPVVPPEPEVPLFSRRTRATAIPRPLINGNFPGPPVLDADGEPRLLIVAEEDCEPPQPEDLVDHEDYQVFSPARRSTAPAPETPAVAPSTDKSMLYGMIAAALLAILILGALWWMRDTRSEAVPVEKASSTLPGLAQEAPAGVSGQPSVPVEAGPSVTALPDAAAIGSLSVPPPPPADSTREAQGVPGAPSAGRNEAGGPAVSSAGSSSASSGELGLPSAVVGADTAAAPPSGATVPTQPQARRPASSAASTATSTGVNPPPAAAKVPEPVRASRAASSGSSSSVDAATASPDSRGQERAGATVPAPAPANGARAPESAPVPTGNPLRLLINSNRPGSRVAINGEVRNPTPVMVELKPGRYQIVVTSSEGEVRTQSLEVRSDLATGARQVLALDF